MTPGVLSKGPSGYQDCSSLIDKGVPMRLSAECRFEICGLGFNGLTRVGTEISPGHVSVYPGFSVQLYSCFCFNVVSGDTLLLSCWWR